MDFELSDDERSLAGAVRKLCAGRFPLAKLREHEGRRSIDGNGWSALAGAGIFNLRLPEERGGLGLGLAHAAVVFEELGRALVPGPLVATHLGAAYVDGAGSGAVPVGLVRLSPMSSEVLPVLVADLGSLGALLVLDDSGVRIVDPGAVEASPVGRGVDPLTPLWRVIMLPEGERVDGTAAAAEMWRDHLVLSAALLVGLCDLALELAVAHSRTREQFGRPIGSFQAVKHLCADMLVRSETARNAVHAAAVTVDQPDVGDAWRAAAGAALLACEAALANARSCIQVHGGMGFTWEIPAHLVLMRARVLCDALGPTSSLADAVAERF